MKGLTQQTSDNNQRPPMTEWELKKFAEYIELLASMERKIKLKERSEAEK